MQNISENDRNSLVPKNVNDQPGKTRYNKAESIQGDQI